MAEGGGGKGTNVGAIYYTCTVDTQGLIDAERQAQKSTGNISASLTETAKAAKTYAASAGAAAASVKEGAKANEAAAAAANKAAAASTKAAKATQENAMSAKALAAAQRNIPAQVTDIVSGLATGQAPLTVLLQQGGQLKDMFGGVLPALRAVGTYLAGLLSPITAVVAAVGVLAYGFIKGREEMGAFNRSLILSGNQSGVTADQLSTLSAKLGSMAGIVRSEAAEALNIFVQAGIAGEAKLAKFTEAAIRMEKAGGPSITNIADAFRELGKDPVKASERLNESVNFLTKDLYMQIRALEEQGKTTQAATLAQNAFADALLDRAPKVIENLGYIERGWNSIKNAVKGAADAAMNIGRVKTLEEDRAELDKLIQRREKYLALAPTKTNHLEAGKNDSRIAELQQMLAAQADLEDKQQVSAQAAADQAKATQTASKWMDQGAQFLDSQARMQREINTATELGVALGLKTEDIQKRVAAIKKSYGVDAKAEEARAYYQGLVAVNADAMGKIDAEERAALADNRKRQLGDQANAATYQQARVEITRKYARERGLIEDQTNQQIAQLHIATTIDEMGKIAAIRDEAVRQADADVKLGLKTEQQAQVAREAATIAAAEAYADLSERSARARADAEITITKDQSAQIALIRDEAIRQAQDGYERGKLSFDEAEQAKTRAMQQAEDARKALTSQRDGTVTTTLQYKANAGGVADQEALIRQQAEVALRATEEARLRDLNASQIYADQKVAIENDMNRRIADMRANANMTALTATSDSLGAILAVMEKSGEEQSGIYKAIFAAQKAFAIASAIVNIQKGLSDAAAQGATWQEKLIAMATVASATAGIVSTIQGTSYGGGRQYGGPTEAGKMYRVNETGAPEMFTASNGNQYMLGAKSGRVTPAADLTSGGGDGSAPVTVNFKHETIINNYGDVQVKQREETQKAADGSILQRTIIDIVASDMAAGGKTARAAKSRFNLKE